MSSAAHAVVITRPGTVRFGPLLQSIAGSWRASLEGALIYTAHPEGTTITAELYDPGTDGGYIDPESIPASVDDLIEPLRSDTGHDDPGANFPDLYTRLVMRHGHTHGDRLWTQACHWIDEEAAIDQAGQRTCGRTWPPPGLRSPSAVPASSRPSVPSHTPWAARDAGLSHLSVMMALPVARGTRPGGSLPPEPAAAPAVPPDLGAWRASDILAERCGIRVTAAGVEELAARGLVRAAGKCRGCQLYSGEDLASVDPAAVADAEARRDRTAAEAAAYMAIREADFRLLARVGLIRPARHVNGKWVRFPVYACAALDDFLARPDIDWPAVRATPPGRRSPLYCLCEPELVLMALGWTPGKT